MKYLRDRPIDVVGAVIATGLFLAVSPMVGLGILFYLMMYWGLYIWLRSKKGDEPLKFSDDFVNGFIPILVMSILVIVYMGITNGWTP